MKYCLYLFGTHGRIRQATFLNCPNDEDAIRAVEEDLAHSYERGYSYRRASVNLCADVG
jgi:hypothetical protein